MTARWMTAAMLMLALAVFAFAADPAPDKQAPLPAPTRIKTDVKAGTITLEGTFCLKQGILDYLAVQSGGHEYEAVTALDVKASLLHQSLLAIGAETGPTEATLDALKKNPPEGVKIPGKIGTKIRITAQWQADGKTVSVPAATLLLNRATKKAGEDAPFIFTGSYFAKDPNTEKEVYMGDMDQALIGVFYQPSGVLNFSKDNGNAYDGAETGYEINKDTVPKVGTPVKLILTLWDKPAEAAK